MTQRQRADPLFTALLNRLRMGLMTAYNVQFLNTTRVGAMAAAAATHGTAMDMVQPTKPQTPTAPALEPLPSSMAVHCFHNSTRSAGNTADPLPTVSAHILP